MKLSPSFFLSCLAGLVFLSLPLAAEESGEGMAAPSGAERAAGEGRTELAGELEVGEFVPPVEADRKVEAVRSSPVEAVVEGERMRLVRVREPDLPLPPPGEVPPAEENQARLPTAEEVSEWNEARKRTLTLGATIYGAEEGSGEGTVSVLHWKHPEKEEWYEAVAGFDAGLLEGIGEFYGDGGLQSLMLVHSRAGGSWRDGALVPPDGGKPAGVREGEVRITRGNAEDAAGVRPVLLLGELLSAEKERLTAYQAERRRWQAEKREWERLNPPPAGKAVIYGWKRENPGRRRRRPERGRRGRRPEEHKRRKPVKPGAWLALLPGLAFGTGPLAGGPEDWPEQAQAVLARGPAGTVELDWEGSPSRFYVLQLSEDLVNWEVFPDAWFGDESHGWGAERSQTLLFARLKYLDLPGVEDLATVLALDLNGDGLPVVFELENGLDPLGSPREDVPVPDGGGVTWGAYYASMAGERDDDGDGIMNARDADPECNLINWEKSPEFTYAWVGADGAPAGYRAADMNAKGQILFAEIPPGAGPPVNRVVGRIWDPSKPEQQRWTEVKFNPPDHVVKGVRFPASGNWLEVDLNMPPSPSAPAHEYKVGWRLRLGDDGGVAGNAGVGYSETGDAPRNQADYDDVFLWQAGASPPYSICSRLGGDVSGHPFNQKRATTSGFYTHRTGAVTEQRLVVHRYSSAGGEHRHLGAGGMVAEHMFPRSDGGVSTGPVTPSGRYLMDYDGLPVVQWRDGSLELDSRQGIETVTDLPDGTWAAGGRNEPLRVWKNGGLKASGKNKGLLYVDGRGVGIGEAEVGSDKYVWRNGEFHSFGDVVKTGTVLPGGLKPRKITPNGLIWASNRVAEGDPQDETATGVFVPVEITVVFGIGPETPIEGQPTSKNLLEAYLETVKVSRQGDVWMVKGKDDKGQDKPWGVELADSRKALVEALGRKDAIVVFDGHSNFGFGPDFGEAIIRSIDDFTNFGARYTDIPLYFGYRGSYPQPEEDSENAHLWGQYDFPFIIISGNDIATNPVNYKPLPINILRFPNSDNIGEGQAFTLQGAGFEAWHYQTGGSKRLMVRAPQTDLPAQLRYKTFFYNACSTGIDYIENFKHGEFIYTTLSCNVHQATRIFAQGVVEGKITDRIMPLLNSRNVGLPGDPPDDPIYEYESF